MKNSLFALLTVVFASTVAAQDYGFWGLNMPPPFTPPAVHLVKEADTLVANITIVATNRKPDVQAADFANALLVLRQAVAKNAALSIKDERTVFGGGEPSMFASSYPGGKFNTRRSASDFKLVHPLNSTKSATDAADVLRQLIGSLRLPGDTDIRIDSMQLEVSDIESLRTPLIEAIAIDAAKLKSLFKESEIVIGGLQSRVEQRPLNNHQVVVFIPYTLAIGSGRRN